MGTALLTTSLWLLLTCILNAELNTSQACETGFFRCAKSAACLTVKFKCDGHMDCEDGSDELNCNMEGIFQDYGNKKIERFPVYHTVKGFDIQLRFSAEKCTGQLVEITSRDTNQFLRITLLDIGPIRMSFSTPIGKGQLNLAMPSKGGFCDGKRHSLSLSIYRGVVSYGVDKVTPVRFYVARLRAPFSSPANIIIGRGIKGCVSGSTVVNRFNWTHEYRVGISSGCSVKKTTARPSKQKLFTYSAQKLETSSGPKCEPLTLAACQTLGYNFTQIPNRLQHKTYFQAAAGLVTLLSKLQPHCSPHLLPFLCRLYLPPCSLDQSASPPCRSLCESVQEDCALLSPLKRWPNQLNCEHFPRANNKTKCFLGSAKVTSKRTTLIRGASVKNAELMKTNSLKTVTTSNSIQSRKPVESATKTTNVKTDEHYTVENPGKATLMKSPSASTTEIKSRVFTTAATKSTSRQMTSLSPSVTTAKPSIVKGKGKLKKSLTTTTPFYTKMSKRNETRNGTDAAGTNIIRSSRWNVSISVLSKSKQGVCGGVLTSLKGQLMSPGYPAGYPSNTTCRWVIVLPSDYHVISFTFHRVYLEEDRNCVYDYIAVYDMLDNQVGQRYCGSITSPIVKHVKGNVAVVVFRSDSANSKKGFILSYKGRKWLPPLTVDN